MTLFKTISLVIDDIPIDVEVELDIVRLGPPGSVAHAMIGYTCDVEAYINDHCAAGHTKPDPKVFARKVQTAVVEYMENEYDDINSWASDRDIEAATDYVKN